MLEEAQRNCHWHLFRAHWRRQYRTIELDDPVLRLAEQLLFTYPLRAYDAVQVASAQRVAALIAPLMAELRFCTADRGQALAAAREGLAVDVIA